jgi:HD-like signal output (HDOD) protein
MRLDHKILQSVSEFPTLPTVYSALSEVIANPRSTANDAANVIASDQSSAAKVLKAANSPIYGYSGRIDTISKAIFFIGFTEVQNLVAAISIIDMFGKSSTTGLFNPVEFWKHSIAVGVITRLIGKNSTAGNPENYFLAGILHDIGKLFFFQFVPKEFSTVLSLVAEKQVPIRVAEREVLGITHTTVGEILAQKWQLPPSISNSIRFHVTGTVDGKADTLTASVHLANIIARCMSLGHAGDDIIPEPNEMIWDILKLPKGSIVGMQQQIEYDFQEAAASILL